MKTSPGLRWACYAIAAAATAAAMWHVDHRGDASGDAIQPVRPAARGLAVPVAATQPAARDDALAILKQRLDAAMSGGRDPFADATPAAAAVAATPAPVAAAPADAPPPPPAFSYVGRWQEQGGTVVFLRSGERVLSVRGPGPLEGQAVVEAIGADSLTIRLAGGERQTVSFAPGATSATTASGAAPAVPVQTSATSSAGPAEEN